MFWYIAVFIAALVVASAMGPKPQAARAAGLEEVQVPTAEEGREIAVLFGTRVIQGPNVVWYGDLETDSIKKSSGGIF